MKYKLLKLLFLYKTCLLINNVYAADIITKVLNCENLSNGKIVSLSIKGESQLQPSLVLGVENKIVSLRILGDGEFSGEKVHLKCAEKAVKKQIKTNKPQEITNKGKTKGTNSLESKENFNSCSHFYSKQVLKFRPDDFIYMGNTMNAVVLSTSDGNVKFRVANSNKTFEIIELPCTTDQLVYESKGFK